MCACVCGLLVKNSSRIMCCSVQGGWVLCHGWGLLAHMALFWGEGQAASTLMWVQVFVQLPLQSLQGGLCSLLYADPSACCADSLPAMQQF